jgi:hypothetical protein
MHEFNISIKKAHMTSNWVKTLWLIAIWLKGLLIKAILMGIGEIKKFNLNNLALFFSIQIGCRFLVAGHWLLVVCCWLPVACFLLFSAADFHRQRTNYRLLLKTAGLLTVDWNLPTLP